MSALQNLFAESVVSPGVIGANLLCRADQIFEAHGLDEVHERFTRLYCPHTLIPAQRQLPITVRHEALLIHTSTLNAVQYSQDVVIVAESLRDCILFEFALDEAFTVEQGNVRTRVEPGHFYIVDPEKPLWQEFGARFRQLNLRIPLPTIQDFLTTERAGNGRDPIQFKKNLWPIAALGEFFGLFLDGVGRRRSGPATAESPRVSAQMEKLLICMIMDSLQSNYTSALEGGLMQVVPGHLKRAEAWIAQNYARDFSPEDLARAAGTGIRTLFAAFRNFRGMTPMTYVRGVRLDKARHLLLDPQEAQRGVTDIAMSCGLAHLSRFARDYRARFGQLPSQTRRAG
jgi:AraC-like DNA-binding protein